MNPCPASGTPSLLPGGPLECGPPTPASRPVSADSNSVLPAAPVNNLMAAPGNRLAHTPRVTRQQSRLCHPRERQHRTARPAPPPPPPRHFGASLAQAAPALSLGSSHSLPVGSSGPRTTPPPPPFSSWDPSRHSLDRVPCRLPLPGLRAKSSQ